jgi:D-aminopeptidase
MKGLVLLSSLLGVGALALVTVCGWAQEGKEGEAVFLISGDIEGMSGFKGGGNKEANNDILHAHFLATAEGLHDGGATRVLLKSFHGIPGEYPDYVKTIRKAVPGEFDLPGLPEAKTGLAMVGFHGLPPECAFGHCYRFSYLYMNGKKIGEITIQVMRAAVAGVPTVFFAGDAFAVAELRAVAPDAVTVTLREGKRGDEGPMDDKMIAAIREGAKKAASMRGKIPVPKLPEKFVLGVPMANEAAAQLAPKMLTYPVKVEGKTVSRESTDFMEVYAFLQDMFRVCDEARRIEKEKTEKEKG